MDWMFEDFNIELDALNKVVREKALTIAKELVEKENLTPKDAIEKAIIRAEEWFYDLGG